MHRISSFAATFFGAWLWLVPPSAAQADLLITVDKAAQRMTVKIDGATRFVWPVSTGRRGTYETPVGEFQPFRMVADHYSKEWDDAPMPHAIFFTNTGHAIHGSFQTSQLGRRASHGCVRLSTRNAKKLFALVRRHGLANAQVVVLPDPNAPVMAKRKAPASTQQAARKPARPDAAIVTAAPAPQQIPSTPPFAIATDDPAYGYAREQSHATHTAAEQPTLALPVLETAPRTTAN